MLTPLKEPTPVEPSEEAIKWSDMALEILKDKGIAPSSIFPSPDEVGGICIAFVNGSLYADIEFFNDGDILAVKIGKGGNPIIWEVAQDKDQIADAINQILQWVEISNANR